ncbi:Hypothetical protein, putative [Bodo saltans]|uniref:Uncharacterized protein n=1 Tax=Bodo saltans TaxID=75058 RepID=A0A0S4IW57_BODSA|nr:Hypothetical protein, putative [Bodo saltans]|eukprot:CUG06035.1 Hypothetical protein, putative [Bodo saltans]
MLQGRRGDASPHARQHTPPTPHLRHHHQPSRATAEASSPAAPPNQAVPPSSNNKKIVSPKRVVNAATSSSRAPAAVVEKRPRRNSDHHTKKPIHNSSMPHLQSSSSSPPTKTTTRIMRNEMTALTSSSFSSVPNHTTAGGVSTVSPGALTATTTALYRPTSTTLQHQQELLSITEKKLKALMAARKLRGHLNEHRGEGGSNGGVVDDGHAMMPSRQKGSSSDVAEGNAMTGHHQHLPVVSPEEQALMRELERLQNPWKVFLEEGSRSSAGARDVDRHVTSAGAVGRERGFARISQLHLLTPTTDGLEHFDVGHHNQRAQFTAATAADQTPLTSWQEYHDSYHLHSTEDLHQLSLEMDHLWRSHGVYEHFTLKDAAELAGNAHSIREAAARVAIGVKTKRDSAVEVLLEPSLQLDEHQEVAMNSPLHVPTTNHHEILWPSEEMSAVMGNNHPGKIRRVLVENDVNDEFGDANLTRDAASVEDSDDHTLGTTNVYLGGGGEQQLRRSDPLHSDSGDRGDDVTTSSRSSPASNSSTTHHHVQGKSTHNHRAHKATSSYATAFKRQAKEHRQVHLAAASAASSGRSSTHQRLSGVDSANTARWAVRSHHQTSNDEHQKAQQHLTAHRQGNTGNNLRPAHHRGNSSTPTPKRNSTFVNTFVAATNELFVSTTYGDGGNSHSETHRIHDRTSRDPPPQLFSSPPNRSNATSSSVIQSQQQQNSLTQQFFAFSPIYAARTPERPPRYDTEFSPSHNGAAGQWVSEYVAIRLKHLAHD